MALFLILVVGSVVILASLLLVVAFVRKGSVAGVPMTTRRLVLRSAVPPEVVYGWLTQHCPTGYSIEDADPAHGIVILSSRPTTATWGFFYPVHVSSEGAGTRVDLGIKSRLLQYGPLVTRAHWKLAHALANLTQSRIEEG